MENMHSSLDRNLFLLPITKSIQECLKWLSSNKFKNHDNVYFMGIAD